jgi:predicted AlkP superfamily phosphohydrolase/phosphomutase
MDRTVLIGLDGATWTALDAYMADGVMPFLRQFVAEGARGDLLSTPNPLTPPAWTSMVTGRTPGYHGIFDFVRSHETPGGLYFTLNTSRDVRCESLWSMVSRQGGSITSLNFPVTYPPPVVQGYVVPGFVPWKHLRRAVHPPEFFAAIKSIAGFDAREMAMDMNQELKSIQYLPEDEYEGWITHHVRREHQWLSIMRMVLTETPTDLVAGVFDGVDKLQHLCWRFIDPALAPRSPTSFEAKVLGLCRDYFRAVDACIAEVVELAGPEARVFIVSDHGFGATHDVFYANVWLEREGLLGWTEAAVHDDSGKSAAARIKSHVVGIDWTKTTAYALTPSSNGIFIRRADGSGHPGVRDSEYEGVRRGLINRLLELRHPQTGARFVQRVMTREQAFPGPASEQAPDLTLVLHDYGFLSVLNSTDAIWPRPEPAGTHRPQGIFAARGPGIAAGARLADANIADIAPTLLHSLGLAVPEELEGHVISQCYAPAFLALRPVHIAGATVPTAVVGEQGGGFTSREDEEITARLRALRYIE